MSKQAIYHVQNAAGTLPPGMIPPKKTSSGATGKTTARTDLLKHEVILNPSITAVALKEKHPTILQNIAIRMIQCQQQKDLGLPAQCTAKKCHLINAMKQKQLEFCQKYKDCTSEEWN